MMSKIYRGQPGESPMIGVDGPDGAYILKPKNEDIGFAWGNPYEGAGPGQFGPNVSQEEAEKIRQRFRNRAAGINQTILAIMTDLLGDEEEAVKVYQRMKHRTVLTWPSNQGWTIGEAQLRKQLDSIADVERETAHIRRSNYARDVVMEGGAGVVWDTDIEGRRKGPR